ncbi:hypothetical protein V5O48_001283 [Marasmius crinis-equi]|uniref:Btz domain-containing protein n=1 Tax=Marasmius crinis-equi TaxID=585013 RepID=A0ABR3FYW7_9AGAR
MPAPMTSSSPTRTVNKPATSKAMARGTASGKKTRLVRRRGRAKGAMDSDDEIEREARSDSDTEDDSFSSESESEPEDIVNGSPHPLTPSTSETPPEASSNTKSTGGVNGHGSFFASSGNWSEMVADETANGPADLPVIEFSELDSHVVSVPISRKSKKTTKKEAPPRESAKPPAPIVEEKADHSTAPTPPRGPASRPFPRRPAGQSARQAYQQKLESDPSYIPTVGEFWGHDDRLLDKDLRSLSGWWRGRWQGRGRGRGFMRGKIGFQTSFRVQNEEEEGDSEAHEVPPVERAWTHDGFEEMKRNEDRRRTQHNAQPPFQSPRGVLRGRGGFPARGRGGRGHFQPHSPSGIPRVWYAMKPDHMWTKQSEAFLYLDPASKPRHGHAGSVRVKLPGSHSRPTKLPLKEAASMPSPRPAVTSTTSVHGSDYGGNKHVQVRLPKHSEKHSEPESKLPESEPSIEDVFTVRPRIAPSKPIPLPQPSPEAKTAAGVPQPPNTVQPTPSSQPLLDPVAQQMLEQVTIEPQQSDPHRRSQMEEAVLRNPTTREPDNEADPRPELPPIQTSFTPPIPQGSPAFSSPYGYAQPLPPGVAVNTAGMTYEVATGRPVYLPPPAMFSRPQPAPFIPGHVHHRSTLSSEFIPQPSSPSSQHNSFIDYSTGQSFFSLPRQSSRIEIRSPGSQKVNAKSSLRTDALSFEPSQQYFPSAPEYNGDGSSEEQARPHVDPPMAYNPYQYYYPDAYGYPPYMDMSQMGQYGVYPQDHAPQGNGYY